MGKINFGLDLHQTRLAKNSLCVEVNGVVNYKLCSIRIEGARGFEKQMNDSSLIEHRLFIQYVSSLYFLMN